MNDLVDFSAVNMAIGKMVQQVVEGEDAQLFFQQVGTLRPDAFQVLDGMCQYVFDYGYLKKFPTKIRDEV
jgi:hypothetical protein